MTIETEGPAPKRRRTASRKKKTDTQMAAPLPIEQQPVVQVEDNPDHPAEPPLEVQDNPANEVPGYDKIVVRDNDANEVPDPVKDVEPTDDPYPDPVEPQPVEPIPEMPPNEMVPILQPVPGGGVEPVTTPVQPQSKPEPEPEPAEPEPKEAEAGEKSPASAHPALVRVKCISHAKPWTTRGPLRYGEQARVPQELADVMVRNGHVEVV